MPINFGGGPPLVCLMETQQSVWADAVSHFLQQERADPYAGHSPAVQILSKDGSSQELERVIYDSLVSFDASTGLAVVKIAGGLVDGSLGWYAEWGLNLTGYADLALAYRKLAADSSVRGVMLHIKSGGGHVAGLDDANTALSALRKAKPVATHASFMASAALWHGVNSSTVSVERAATLGSIGVMSIHKEYSKAFAQEGVTVKVVRSGDKKALANVYEPLSPEAEAELQAAADTYHQLFISDVAKARGVTSAEVRQSYGDGRTFIGQEAVKVGLVDSVKTFSEARSAFLKSISQAPAAKSTSQKAESQTNVAETLGTGEPQPPVASDNSTKLKVGVPMDDDEELQALAAAAGVVTGAVQPQDNAEGTTDLDKLKADLAQAKASLETATADLEASKAAFEKLQAEAQKTSETLAAMTTVIGRSVEAMCVPLAMQAGVAGTSPEQVLARHTEVAALFVAKFPIGGKAKRIVTDAPTNTNTTPVASTVDVVAANQAASYLRFNSSLKP